MGFIPPIFWLWFWLREDTNPEPRKLVFRAFFYGMFGAVLSIPMEFGLKTLTENIFILLLGWALIEESAKYLAASRAALRKKAFDEPVDAIIYLITAALGFASAENVIFLLKAANSSGVTETIMTGNLRFVGAILLHVATSGLVGASIAYAFFHKEKMRRNVIGGIILSTALHFAFNLSILKSESSYILWVFVPLWILIIAIIFLFEKIKNLKI